MHRILIADSLESTGIDILRQSGAEVVVLAAADKPRLKEIIADFDALVVRSATKADGPLLRAGKRLKVVGRAGIGVDNVDVVTATELGILVVNAPTANLMSATEHTFALMLALARRIPAADASLKNGVWDRKSFTGVELQGKTLGIIGFGRIGQRVAMRARGFEMKVLAYDPFLDAAAARRLEVELVPVDDLLAAADVVTFHTPLTPETKNLLDERRLGLMKPHAMVVNCGRGGVIDEAALLAALDRGHLGGAALDVFMEEPPLDFALAKHPRVVATPHLGAQTEEAQLRIAIETAEMVIAALAGSMSVSAVNLPFRPTGAASEPYLRLGEALGRLASGLLGGSISRVQTDLWGIDDALTVPTSVAVLKGVLTPFLGEVVNYVNAEHVAEGRGIATARVSHGRAGEASQLVAVKVSGEAGEIELVGTLYDGKEPRVVRVAGFQLEFRPEGNLLLLENRDVPGVVGKIGTLLGEAGINIGDIHLARRSGPARPGQAASEAVAMAALRLDQPLTADARAALAGLPAVISVRYVEA